jgi:hypothetical protein
MGATPDAHAYVAVYWKGLLHEWQDAAADAALWAQSAQWLARGGEGALADAVLGRALRTLLGVADAAASRDALRLARGALRDGDRAGLRDIETVWGRHRRALLRPDEERALAVADLAARSWDAYEDANADGWRALRCAPGITGCEPEELRDALTRARAQAPTSPVVLRAETPASAAISRR